MNYSPRHNDTKMRAIYGVLVVLAFAFMNIGTGLVQTIFMSLSVICLCFGVFLFIRHDMTTYTYIVYDNEGELEFFVDKATGKRNAYVCYYPLCDCVTLLKYEKGTKKEIEEKYGKTFFYNYCHNRFSYEKYIIVFQNNGYCDAVICQLDQVNYEYLQNAISTAHEKAKENKEEPTTEE